MYEEGKKIKELAINICIFLEEKKAIRIVLMDLYKVNPYFRYFIIATASAPIHLTSLSQEIQKKFQKEKRTSPELDNLTYIPHTKNSSRLDHRHTEVNTISGDSQSGWLIIDIIDIVIHLFLEEQRSFYNLERLWGDAIILYDTNQTKRS